MIIKTQGLTTYYGKNRGIEDLSLIVNQGEIYGFVGPNGAGKSTLMRTLLNFIRPRSGSAHIFGLDVEENSREIKKNLGYVPGEIKYYSHISVEELLNYSARLKGAEASQVAGLVSLLGLEGKKKFYQLSLGNKKKVALAQAFLGQPKLLILDEPTSGLDPLFQRIFSDLILDFKSRGGSVFLSSHNLREIGHLCDRASVIRQGFIVDSLDLRQVESGFGWIVEVKGALPREAISELAEKVYEGGDRHWNFLYKGSMDNLIASLGLFPLEDLLIRKESLEDRFLDYYRGDHDQSTQL